MSTPLPTSDEPDLRLFKAIVEQATEAIVFADHDGIIRIWNSGAETVFGFAAAEVVGQSLDVIVPERFRQAHWVGFHSAVEGGRVRHPGQVRTTRALHKLGRRLYVDMSFALVTDEAGSVLGSVAVGRDVSARYE